MKVAAYIRVSTEEQVKEGYSLDAQKNGLTNFCKSQIDWNLVEIYHEEGKSAKDLNRPELKRMLEDAKKGEFDILLVYRLDRLTRSVSDLYDLLNTFEVYGVKFKSATEIYDTTTAMGKLFITIVAALAQWERENLSERVRFGMEQLVRNGKWHGGPVPFSYKWDGETMHIVQDEYIVVRKLRDIYMSGEGFGSTAKKLNSLGMLRRGQPWSAQSVGYTLDNPFYAGRIRYGEKKKNGKYASRKKEDLVNVIWSITGFPQVFTWEEYIEHTDRMKRREFLGHSKKREYRFTGVIRCARCGATLIGRPYKRKKKDGTCITYYNYICSSRSTSKGCDLPLLKQDFAQDLIINYIKNIVIDSSKVPRQNEQKVNFQDEIDRLHKELKNINERRKKWQYMFVEDLLSVSDLRARKLEEDSKEEDIKSELVKLGDSGQKSNGTVSFDKIKNLLDVWDLIDDVEKRELMQMTFAKIVVECQVRNGKTASGKGRRLPFYIQEVEFN